MQPAPGKVCPRCRQVIHAGAPSCVYCGQSFVNAGIPQPGQQPFQGPYPGQPYPPHVVYVPVPAQPQSGGGQTALKWVLALLVFACMGVGVILMAKLKGGSQSVARPTQRDTSTGLTPGQGVPTNIFNDEATSSSYKVSVTWTNTSASDSCGAQVENSGNADLPNLYIQVLTKDQNSNDNWSDPYSIDYPGGHGLPAGKGGSLSLPYAYTELERLHAYYVESTPAGPIQHEVRVDQASKP